MSAPIIPIALSAVEPVISIANADVAVDGYVTYRGMTVGGVIRTYSVPTPTYYFDSSVTSSGDGLTAATAFKTLAEMPPLIDGDVIGLAADSYFREMLDVSEADDIIVTAYGDGKLPTLDCSDIIANASFVLDSGRTNAYRISWLPEIDKNHPSVWEDGVRLVRLDSLSACESTPGSFYAPLPWTVGSSQPLYVHSSDSSAIPSNGKTYESAVRGHGVVSDAPAKVCFVHGTKNKHNDGSIVLRGLGSRTFGCIGSNGVVHNIFVAANSNDDPEVCRDCIAYLIDPAVAATNFVSYQTSITGVDVIFENCFAINSADDNHNNHSGFHWHGSGGAYRNGVLNNCVSTYCSGMAGGDCDSLTISSCLAWECGTLYSGGLDDITIRDSEWYLSDESFTYRRAVWIQADSATLTITNTVFNYASNYAVYANKSLTLTMGGCTIIARGADAYAAVVTNASYGGSATTNLVITDTIFSGIPDNRVVYQLIPDNGNTIAFDNDNNIYSEGDCDCQIGATTYSTVGAFLTATGEESLVADPGFAGTVADRDYSLTTRGAAMINECGARLVLKDFDQDDFITDVILEMISFPDYS